MGDANQIDQKGPFWSIELAKVCMILARTEWQLAFYCQHFWMCKKNSLTLAYSCRLVVQKLFEIMCLTVIPFSHWTEPRKIIYVCDPFARTSVRPNSSRSPPRTRCINHKIHKMMWGTHVFPNVVYPCIYPVINHPHFWVYHWVYNITP